MGRNRLFVRRRDGRIEIRLNEFARAMAKETFGAVVRAEREVNHEWHNVLNGPIDPSSDHDDPVATLTRQNDMASNAELALVTVDEQFINDSEAWAWLSTFQVALRSIALAHALVDEESLERSDETLVSQVRAVQQFLFELAECL